MTGFVLQNNFPVILITDVKREGIMSVVSLFLQLCAIDWYFVEGNVLRSQGQFVYPPEIVEAVADTEQVQVPHLVFKIRCEEQ